MRMLVGVSLLIAFTLATGCAADEQPTLNEAAVAASAEARDLIDDLVKDEYRARMAKQSARKVMLTIADYYANVAAQRNELVKLSGKSSTTRADCQPVLDSLKALRIQFSEQLIDEWLLVRAWMTPDEWVSFNTRLQGNMGLSAN